jgi:hypothetical protein
MQRFLTLVFVVSLAAYFILGSPFSQYVSEDANVMLRDGSVVSGKQIALEKFKHTLDELRKLGIKPVVFAPPPRPGFNAGKCLVNAVAFNRKLEECDFSASQAALTSRDVREFLFKIDSEYDVVSLGKFICHDDICKAAIGNTFIYRDEGHLSREGSALIGKRMDFYKLVIDQ